MSDAAAFTATFSGFRSLTDGDYRISFDFPGEKLKDVVEVLAQGGKPSAAKGTWFAIARLNNVGDTEVCDDSLKSGSHALLMEGNSASGESQRTPARTLSNRIYLNYCRKPVFRRFLEEFCQDIVAGRDVNNAEFAKEVVKLRLGIGSLSEVDSDPVASEQAEQLLNLFASWERGYVEAPRIQQENQA